MTSWDQCARQAYVSDDWGAAPIAIAFYRRMGRASVRENTSELDRRLRVFP
jgi:hypothetical protein